MGHLPPKLRRCQIVLNVRPTDEIEINEILHIWDLEDDPGTKSGRNLPTEFEFRRFWRQNNAALPFFKNSNFRTKKNRQKFWNSF